MTQILLAGLLGIVTSLIAGIILIWTGERAARYLRRLPTKRRVALYSGAYIRALNGHPLGYLHVIVLRILGIIFGCVFIIYCTMNYISFRVDLMHPTTTTHNEVKAVLNSLIGTNVVFNPW